jgi:hypothetical protein
MQPPNIRRWMRYVWARVGLDYGILLLVGQGHVDRFDRLICTLQEDGSCRVVERSSWVLEDEGQSVAGGQVLLVGGDLGDRPHDAEIVFIGRGASR